MGETRDRADRAVPTGWKLGGVLATVFLLGMLVAVIPALPADAAPPRCPCRAGSGQTTCREPSGAIRLCNREEEPGTTTPGGTSPGGTGPGGGGPQTWCPPRHWITTTYDGVPTHLRPYEWDAVYREHPDAIFQYDACTCPGSASGFCPGVTTRWFLPAEPVLPSPEEVAEGAWASIEATLEPPAVVTDPPAGDPSVVQIPTFVSVTNWQDPISEEACDDTGTVCVLITADPSLTWDPGEDVRQGWNPRQGSGAIPCEDGGTVYDPDGPPAAVQAEEPGACAHSYRYRTDVDGRPSVWDGVVTITWETAWETTSGPVEDSGTFGDVTLTTDLPRDVVDVSTVVVEDLRRGMER